MNPETPYQFERVGYFRQDPVDSSPENLVFNASHVFNRIVQRCASRFRNWALTDRRCGSLVKSGTINSSAGQQVLGEMFESDGSPEAIVDARGLRQVNDDSALIPVIEAVLSEFPDKAAEYRDGKTGLIGFFTGQVMRRMGGTANPQRTKDLLSERLSP
jgi:Asp-tRNA(Asn)/Glu-tRNA(Gln) amidotransferase B subunit